MPVWWAISITCRCNLACVRRPSLIKLSWVLAWIKGSAKTDTFCSLVKISCIFFPLLISSPNPIVFVLFAVFPDGSFPPKWRKSPSNCWIRWRASVSAVFSCCTWGVLCPLALNPCRAASKSAAWVRAAVSWALSCPKSRVFGPAPVPMLAIIASSICTWAIKALTSVPKGLKAWPEPTIVSWRWSMVSVVIVRFKVVLMVRRVLDI